MKYLYYIIKNGRSEIHNLQTDRYIFKVEASDEKNEIIRYYDFEGPYSNINELITDSKFYNELKLSKPKTASKLILPQNIPPLKKIIFVPKNKKFDNSLFTFLNHSFVPKFKNGEISGIHFFEPTKTRILNIYDINLKGVLDAEIQMYDNENKKWINKRTTLFPLHWTEGNLLAELELAYLYRFPIVNKKNQFGGVTSKGIKVIFIIVNDIPKTAYPIL